MAKQTPIYVIFDGGNSLWKSVIFGDDIKRREIVIPHAIIEDEGGTRFQSVQSRFAGDLKNFDREWLKFGEQSFVVGNSAEAQGVVTRKTGSAKYTNDYYGVSLMAILLAAMPYGGRFSQSRDAYGLLFFHPPSHREWTAPEVPEKFIEDDSKSKGAEARKLPRDIPGVPPMDSAVGQ